MHSIATSNSSSARSPTRVPSSHPNNPPALNADLIDGRFSVKLGDAAGNDGTADGGRLLSDAGDKIADNTIPVAKLTGAGANFWDGNGTSVWRTGGNVGIGTTAPKAKLDVAGNARISGSLSENGQYVPSGEEDLRIIRGGGTASTTVGIVEPPFSGSGYTYKKIS